MVYFYSLFFTTIIMSYYWKPLFSGALNFCFDVNDEKKKKPKHLCSYFSIFYSELKINYYFSDIYHKGA